MRHWYHVSVIAGIDSITHLNYPAARLRGALKGEPHLMLRHLIASAGLAGLLAATGAPPGAFAADLSDPPVFTSQRGTLDLVMVAGAVPTTIADRNNAAAWVYTVCPRTAPIAECLPRPAARTRLAACGCSSIRATLCSIRLVNKLPPNPDAKHIADNPAADRQPDQPAHPWPDRRAAPRRRAKAIRTATTSSWSCATRKTRSRAPPP